MCRETAKSCGDYRHSYTEIERRYRDKAKAKDRRDFLVAFDDDNGLFTSATVYRFPILPCGFYACYPFGQNASGEYFPRDESRADSTYGGKTIWGGDIGAIAERYGWSFEAILWGVSWANAQKMIADAIRVDYSNDKTNKVKEDTVLDINDPKAFSKLNRLSK